MSADCALPTAPVVVEHDGIFVVRDDLYPGGTKARFLGALYGPAGASGLFKEDAEELVYASPPEGGAQTALAHVARALGRRATIFTAARAKPHARTLMAAALGARVEYVRPGYLSVAHARAAEYCAQTGARLVPFGCDVPYASVAIAAAANLVDVDPDEVWCASGSGVLARALSAAFPSSEVHSVQVGRTLTDAAVAGAEIHICPLAFGERAPLMPPFPSDPHYDAKAWDVCERRHGGGTVLFWNVTGPADPTGRVA